MPKAARTSVAVFGAGAALTLGLAVAGLVSSSGSAAPLVSTSETTKETTEQTTSTKYRAAISARAEVPKPTGVRPNAGGTFAVTLTGQGSSYSVKWTLTFRNLTGKAAAAHIHRGKPGKAGPVVVALCGPCRSGRTGNASVSKAVATSLRAGSTYVNIHTTKNKAGEIRGQIKNAG